MVVTVWSGFDTCVGDEVCAPSITAVGKHNSTANVV